MSFRNINDVLNFSERFWIFFVSFLHASLIQELFSLCTEILSENPWPSLIISSKMIGNLEGIPLKVVVSIASAVSKWVFFKLNYSHFYSCPIFCHIFKSNLVLRFHVWISQTCVSILDLCPQSLSKEEQQQKKKLTFISKHGDRYARLTDRSRY